MATRTYHDLLAGIAAALLAWGLALGAPAAPLRAGEMWVGLDAAWQRGDPAQEAEADAMILTRVPAAGTEEELTLYLPRRGTPIREQATQFRDQLARKWRQQHGAAARIETRSLDGRDWHTCRRPSRDGHATVFQWVTLESGRAYSLVWFASGARDRLPDEADALMRGIAFAAPQAGAALAAAEARPPAASPDAVRPEDGWRLERVILARPADSVLEALAQMDARRLTPGSELTGHGLMLDAAGLEWFIRGVRREHGAGAEAVPFRVGGRVRWAGLPASLDQAPMLPLTLDFDAGPEAGPEANRIGLRLQWLDLCLEAGQVPLAHAHMARGSHAALERLLEQRPTACPQVDVQGLPEAVLVQAGAERQRVVHLALPRPEPRPPDQPGLTRAWVLAARPFASATEDQPGDALLRQAGVYFLYAPPP